MDKLQNQLDEVVSQRLERELHQISERILESITPYARFVQVEEQKTSKAEATVKIAQKNIRDLRTQILR